MQRRTAQNSAMNTDALLAEWRKGETVASALFPYVLSCDGGKGSVVVGAETLLLNSKPLYDMMQCASGGTNPVQGLVICDVSSRILRLVVEEWYSRDCKKVFVESADWTFEDLPGILTFAHKYDMTATERTLEEWILHAGTSAYAGSQTSLLVQYEEAYFSENVRRALLKVICQNAEVCDMISKLL